MKILLIQPDCAKGINIEFVSLQFPINLGYIASSLLKEGHDVKMLDFNVMDRKLLAKIISKYNPDVVGVTAMTSSIYHAKEIVSEIKKMNEKIITVLGGVHASALPIETMKEIKSLDYLVFGEGEKTIVELVDCIAKNKAVNDVRGIVYRKGRKIIKNKPRELIENLDSVAFPARDLIPIELYARRYVTRGFSRKEKKIIEIMTGRGCPNRCIFCAGHVNYGFRVRFRSYENIIEEIEECIKKYEISHISIEDDTFTLNKELVKKLCGFFKSKHLTWNCNTRVNTVDYELFKLLSNSGCKKITFGIESGSQEMLNKIKKGITVEQSVKAVKEAKKAGIRYVECDFMIGAHPDETIDDIKKSVGLIYKLMPDFLAVHIMCPFPGTEAYKIMVKKKYLDKNPDWSQFTVYGNLKRYKGIKNFSSEEMAELQKKIYKEYYSSLKYIFSQLVQIRTLSEIKYFVRLGVQFLNEFLMKKHQKRK